MKIHNSKLKVQCIFFFLIITFITCAYPQTAVADKSNPFRFDFSGLESGNPPIFMGAEWGMTPDEVEKVIGQKLKFEQMRIIEENIGRKTHGTFFDYTTDDNLYRTQDKDSKKTIETISVSYAFVEIEGIRRLFSIDYEYLCCINYVSNYLLREKAIRDLLQNYEFLMSKDDDLKFKIYLREKHMLITYIEYKKPNPLDKKIATYISYEYAYHGTRHF